MSDSDTLRPIGTEFWGEPTTSWISSDSALRRYKYRVVAHSKCQTMSGKTEVLETVEAIASQRQEIIGIEFLGPEYPLPRYKRLFDGEWKDEP